MTYPIPHITELRDKAIRYKLPGPFWIRMLPLEDLQRMYNGIGSDKYKMLLKPTTELFTIYEPAALWHDAQWSEYGRVMGCTFEESNRDFLVGCHICADKAKPIVDVFRPTQRRIYREIGTDLFKIVNGPIGRDVWKSHKPPIEKMKDEENK